MRRFSISDGGNSDEENLIVRTNLRRRDSGPELSGKAQESLGRRWQMNTETPLTLGVSQTPAGHTRQRWSLAGLGGGSAELETWTPQHEEPGK